MFTGEEATAQVVATELQGMHQRVVSESGRLDEEVQRTRQEVAREAQVRDPEVEIQWKMFLIQKDIENGKDKNMFPGS